MIPGYGTSASPLLLRICPGTLPDIGWVSNDANVTILPQKSSPSFCGEVCTHARPRVALCCCSLLPLQKDASYCISQMHFNTLHRFWPFGKLSSGCVLLLQVPFHPTFVEFMGRDPSNGDVPDRVITSLPDCPLPSPSPKPRCVLPVKDTHETLEAGTVCKQLAVHPWGCSHSSSVHPCPFSVLTSAGN